MKKVAIDDFAVIRKLTDLTASPDGTRAVLTVTEGSVEENRYNTAVWVYGEDGVRRLTGGTDGKKPLWLDGDTILFQGDREREKDPGSTVFYRISLHGGEAEKAFAVPMKVNSLLPRQTIRHNETFQIVFHWTAIFFPRSFAHVFFAGCINFFRKNIN